MRRRLKEMGVEFIGRSGGTPQSYGTRDALIRMRPASAHVWAENLITGRGEDRPSELQLWL